MHGMDRGYSPVPFWKPAPLLVRVLKASSGKSAPPLLPQYFLWYQVGNSCHAAVKLMLELFRFFLLQKKWNSRNNGNKWNSWKPLHLHKKSAMPQKGAPIRLKIVPAPPPLCNFLKFTRSSQVGGGCCLLCNDI